MSDIGTRIREARIARKLTQAALCGEGVSSGYMSLIESGKREPSTRVVTLLAERMGMSVEELLGVPEEPRANEQARLEVNFARMALLNANPAEAVRIVSGIDLTTLDNLTANEAGRVLAQGLEQTGDILGSVDVLRALVERNRRDLAWSALATAATTLTVTLSEAGDVNAAVELSERTLVDVERAGLVGTEEHLRLGSIHVGTLYARGDVLTASHAARKLIGVADRVGTPRARGSVYWNAAVVAHAQGSVDEAIRLTDRAVALLGEDSGENRDLPRLRLHYAWLLLHQDRPAAREALAQLTHVEKDDNVRRSQLDLGIVATLRGRAYLCLGDVEEAADHATMALTLLGPSEHMDRTAALILLGDVGAARFEADLADESYREARKVLTGMEMSRDVARLWRQLGDSLRRIGDQPGALHAYDAALTLAGMQRTPETSRVRVVAA